MNFQIISNEEFENRFYYHDISLNDFMREVQVRLEVKNVWNYRCGPFNIIKSPKWGITNQFRVINISENPNVDFSKS